MAADPWVWEQAAREAAREAAYQEGFRAAMRGQGHLCTDSIAPLWHQPLSMQIPFQRLHPNAKPPTRAHDTDAGYDLYAAEGKFPLQPGTRRLVRTGIALAIPAGYYGHICDRSGNALKRGLHVLGGIVDHGYSGEVGVILLNTSQEPAGIEAGERIAQIIIKRHESPTFIEAEQLDETARAAGGFGSTGS